MATKKLKTKPAAKKAQQAPGDKPVARPAHGAPAYGYGAAPDRSKQ